MSESTAHPRQNRAPSGVRGTARPATADPQLPDDSSRGARTVLLRGGEVHSPADPFATAMVVERGQVAWVGSEGAADAFADGVDEVVDLEGALVTPAFTDAHVHTTATGLALTGLDLSAARTLTEAMALVREFAAARPA
ncbi:amidohydrolase family protein, partial [Streptomyces sp. ActVer]|uniref:amidohydrolase family protein n=1 Tax=Streptomyces sp. ActVer TaxID=3014558 RepID=UPI0022B39B0E